jgi:hypothetical protein
LTFTSLVILLIISLFTIRDVWVCELDEENKNQSHICKELRRAVNCKTTIAPPIKAEVLLNINNSIRASAYAFCGWDTAVSEIRLCFIFLSFIALYYAAKALTTQSKKLCEIVYNINKLVFIFIIILCNIISNACIMFR